MAPLPGVGDLQAEQFRATDTGPGAQGNGQCVGYSPRLGPFGSANCLRGIGSGLRCGVTIAACCASRSRSSCWPSRLVEELEYRPGEPRALKRQRQRGRRCKPACEFLEAVLVHVVCAEFREPMHAEETLRDLDLAERPAPLHRDLYSLTSQIVGRRVTTLRVQLACRHLLRLFGPSGSAPCRSPCALGLRDERSLLRHRRRS